jgi:Ca2+-binding RTX toxin-like protein
MADFIDSNDTLATAQFLGNMAPHSTSINDHSSLFYTSSVLGGRGFSTMKFPIDDPIDYYYVTLDPVIKSIEVFITPGENAIDFNEAGLVGLMPVEGMTGPSLSGIWAGNQVVDEAIVYWQPVPYPGVPYQNLGQTYQVRGGRISFYVTGFERTRTMWSIPTAEANGLPIWTDPALISYRVEIWIKEYDAVERSFSYTLAPMETNLRLIGTGNISGTGNSLANTLLGNEGNNLLDGGEGNDRLYGGNGDDQLVGGTGNDILNGGTGNNTLTGSMGDDTYYVGPAGTDMIVELPDGGTDTVYSSHTIYSLPDNVENGVINTGDGSGDLYGNDHQNLLVGGAGSNFLLGAGGNDVLRGGAGDDVLGGGEDSDQLIGGVGDDLYLVDTPLDIIVEGASEGFDAVYASFSCMLGPNLEELALVYGSGDINGTGNSLNNQLFGNDGNNILDGGIGLDSYEGSLGDDTYVVDNILEQITENPGEGTETVWLTASGTYTLPDWVENLVLKSETARTAVLQGNGLANTIVGNSKGNTLYGAGGNDTLVGGLGKDIYIIDAAGDTIVETGVLTTEVDTVRSAITYTLGANLENLTLTGSAAINGTGNELKNVVLGNAGNNLLDGGAGADKLAGGLGDDTYVIDLLLSGTRVKLEDRLTELAGEGTDNLMLRTSGDLGLAAPATLTLGANLENLDASGTGTNKLNLTGNAANNTITGNAGDNTIKGGGGSDSFTGGAGADRFIIDRVTSLVAQIGDFEAGTDTLGLGQKSYAALFSNGVLKDGAFANGAAATTAAQRLFYDAGTGGLYYDSDGTGVAAAVQVATLTNTPASLAASDFVLVAGS